MIWLCMPRLGRGDEYDCSFVIRPRWECINLSNSDTQISIGAGYYEGSAAVIGAFHYIDNNVLLNVGASVSDDGRNVVRGGVTLGF